MNAFNAVTPTPIKKRFIDMALLLVRRRVLAGLASLTATIWWRSGSAQVGSGGSGITQSIGSADLVVGTVTLRRAGQPAANLVQGTKLLQGDQIETISGAETHIAFDDGGYLAIRPNSTVKIAQYIVTGDVTDSATIDLIRGALRSVTGWIGKLDAPRYRITASTATIGVRGTDHEVVLVPPEEATTSLEAGVHNRVNEGATTLRNTNGVVNIASGDAAYAPSSGATPVPYAVVPAFFNRLRTAQDRAVDNHARNIRQRMEERLRERGKLRPNERFNEFRQRQQPLRQRRADQNQPVNTAGGQPSQATSASNERQAAQRVLAEQRQERIRQRQERAAQNREARRARTGEERRTTR
jgi:hypothetical protein